jgi:hypothetical protein
VRTLPWELAAPELEREGLRLWRRAPRNRGKMSDVRGVQGALNRIEDARLIIEKGVSI